MIASFLGLLFNPSAWAVVALSLIMGFSTGYIKGYDTATAKHRVAALQEEVANWKKAAENNAKILEEDRDLAEFQEQEVLRLRSLVKEISDAQPAPNPSCRLSARQLWQLRVAIGS